MEENIDVQKRLVIFLFLIALVFVAIPVSATFLTLKKSGFTYAYYNSYLCERAYATCTASGGGLAAFEVCWIINGRVQPSGGIVNVPSGMTNTAYTYYVDKGFDYPYTIKMYQR